MSKTKSHGQPGRFVSRFSHAFVLVCLYVDGCELRGGLFGQLSIHHLGMCRHAHHGDEAEKEDGSGGLSWTSLGSLRF